MAASYAFPTDAHEGITWTISMNSNRTVQDAIVQALSAALDPGDESGERMK